MGTKTYKWKGNIQMVTRSGYLSEEASNEVKINNAISISEQETEVLFMRDQDHAEIYTSDSTQMTRLDKLCKSYPENYVLIEDTGRGKIYRLNDKTLLSFRAKKKEVSDGQRQAAGERMRQYQASRKL